jgi:transposase
MWTDDSRGKYERKGLRYPSDLTNEEWALVEPHLPPPRQRSRFASPDRREVLNAILYVLSTGCQWRALPKGFPAKSTVHDYFVDWHGDGTLTRIHHALYCELRELEGRSATPTTSIVDSQSVKGAEKGGLRTTRRAMTAPRSSKARNVTSPSTRSA